MLISGNNSLKNRAVPMEAPRDDPEKEETLRRIREAFSEALQQVEARQIGGEKKNPIAQASAERREAAAENRANPVPAGSVLRDQNGGAQTKYSIERNALLDQGKLTERQMTSMAANYSAAQAEKARKEYEDYIKSEEYRSEAPKPQPYAAGAGIARNQGSSYGAMPQQREQTATPGQSRANELKTMADYWQNQADTYRGLGTTMANMEIFRSWPSEDQQALQDYYRYRQGSLTDWLETMQASRTGIVQTQNRDSADAAYQKLVEKYGAETVKNVAASVQRYENEKVSEAIQKFAEENSQGWGAAGSSLLSVGANTAEAILAPIAVASAASQDKGQYSTIDPNFAGSQFGTYAGTVRQSVGEQILGEKGGFLRQSAKGLYDAGMSALDSLARMAVGGKTGSLVLAGTGSFGQTVQQASSQGASPLEAVGLGIVNGGLEVLTEKVSLDKLLGEIGKNPKNAAQVLVGILVQGGVEVSEEELSLLGSTLAEAAILREKSSYNQTVQQLVAGGMSYDEAVAEANKALVMEAWQTMYTSFMSGGMMSGATQIGDYAAYRRTQAANAGDAKTQAKTPQQEAVDALTSGIEIPKTEAQPMSESQMRWRGAVSEAMGVQTQKTTAPSEAMVVSSGKSAISESNREKNTLAYTLATNIDSVRDMEPVTKLSGNEISDGTMKLSDQIRNFFKKIGNKVSRNGFGEVELGEYGVGGVLNHRPVNRAKVLSLAAVPDVIRNGRQIGYDPNWKGRGYESFVFAAPVSVGGTDVYVAAVVNRLPDNKFYLSEMVDSQGNYVRIEKSPSGSSKNELPMGPENQQGRDYAGPEGLSEEGNPSANAEPTPPSDNSIAKLGKNVNAGNAEMDHGAVGAASRGFSQKYALIDQYGAIPEGENPVRADQLPISTTGEDRVSYTARTALEAEATPDEFAPLIENETIRGGFSFIPITNDQTVQNAAQTIRAEGWRTARANWTAAVRQGRTGADITAQGALFYNHAVNNGSYQEAMDILLDYQQAVRNAAQAVQAARILKTLTPENRLYMIRRSIQRMAEDMHLNREITIDDNLARRYQETRDDAEADRILDQIARDVARQIPPTLGERITALRYLNMLGNFRTQVRNFSGNVGAKFTYLAKDEIAATIESLASALSGGRFRRTKVNWVDRTTRNAARADYDNVADWISGGGRANDRGTESDEFARRVQENRRILPQGLEQYRRGTDWAMNNRYFGDAAFGREAYARALAGYLNARGIRTDNLETVDRDTLDQAREYAVRQAQEATFRDNNQVSDFVSRALRGRNTPTWARVIGEAVMPFRKTPANVLVRAEEFSPLGLINSLVRSAQAAAGQTNLVNARGAIGRFAQTGQDITGADIVESWAKTLTGTGLFAIGWALSNMGYLRGGPDDDEDKAAFDELNGYQNYAIQLPNGTSFTIDFLSPAAIPMLLGAQFDSILKDGDLTWSDLDEVFSALADPMIEMSMLQGVNDTIDAIRYADNSMGQFLINAGVNYLTQALGNTLLGQIERSTEGSRMTTYVDKDSDVPAWLQRNLGKLSQKFPIWDYQQTPYIDQWGREQKNPEGIANWLYQMLSPAYVDKANVDKVAKELYRLNEAQSDVNVFPQSPESSLTYTDKDGNRHENYNLSAAELDELKRTEGQTQARIAAELIQGGDYAALTDAQKAKAVSLAYDYAREYARGQVLQGYDGAESWMQGIEGKEAAAIIEKVAAAEFTDAFSAITTAWREGYGSDAEARKSLENAFEVFDSLSPEMQKAVTEASSGRLGYYLTAKEKDMDTETFIDLYRQYWDIDQSGKSESEKAAQWSYTLEKAQEAGTITKAQKDALKDEMVYMQMFPAETEKFDQLTESGLSADEAQDLGWLIQGLKIQDGYKEVRPVQKAEAISKSSLSEADKIAALKIYGSDAQDENLDEMLNMGFSAAEYVKAWQTYADEDAKGGKGTKERTIQAYMKQFKVNRATAEAIYDIYG